MLNIFIYKQYTCEHVINHCLFMVETEKHARADAFLVNFSHELSRKNKFLNTSFSLKNIKHRL